MAVSRLIHRRAFPLLLALWVLGLIGCNVNRIAADQTAKVLKAGAPRAASMWDYDLVGDAMPATIVQGETLLYISPDNETLLLGLSNAYVSYCWGWLQMDWERADAAGDFETADRVEHRVMLLYTRARDLGLRALRAHDTEGKLDEVLAAGDVAKVQTYVRRVFAGPEDVQALYWAGLAWGSAMANSGGDLEAIADAPIARTLLERSTEIDPAFNHAGGLGILGSVEAAFPSLFGGDMAKSKAYFERALKLSKGRNHLVQVGYAKGYAVATQDRELFLKLLQEVLDAPDQGSDIRLSNTVARRRAQLYIQRVDEWFPPPL